MQPAFLPAMIVGAPGGTEASGGRGAIVVHLADGARVVISADAPAALVSATLKALRR